MKRKIKLALKWLLAGIFVATGGYHFGRLAFDREFDLWLLPWPYAVLYLSGGLELMLGIMLFFRTMQVIAAWALIVLLISTAPAHIYFVLDADRDFELETMIVWGRLVFHFVLIAWTFWYTRSTRRIPAVAANPPVTAKASTAAAVEPAVADTAGAQEKERRSKERRNKDRRNRP
jgi:uncharacterized membrane protein